MVVPHRLYSLSVFTSLITQQPNNNKRTNVIIRNMATKYFRAFLKTNIFRFSFFRSGGRDIQNSLNWDGVTFFKRIYRVEPLK